MTDLECYINARTRPDSDQRGGLSITDYVLYGEWHMAALSVQLRQPEGMTSPGRTTAAHYIGAVHYALTSPRAIVPYGQYRDLRRMIRLKRAATWLHAYPHKIVQYRYSFRRGEGSIRNWIDGSAYAPDVVPLPAPKPHTVYIRPTSAIRDAGGEMTQAEFDFYPKKITKGTAA